VEREGVDSLITYRALPGTIEAMGAEPPAQEPPRAWRRRLVVDYDPMAYPPVANNRPDDGPEEPSP
jgi:hypothetical protein